MPLRELSLRQAARRIHTDVEDPDVADVRHSRGIRRNA